MVTKNKQHSQTATSRRRGRSRLKQRTIANTKQRRGENDGIYIFKLVLVALVSTLWLKFAVPIELGKLILTAVPAGLLVTLLSIRVLEADAFERRIWYAVALVVGLITYFVPAGIVI